MKSLVSIVTLIVATALAFADDRHVVAGFVADPTGARVPGAVITFESHGATVKKRSDKEGRFSARVPKAQYNVRVMKKSFCPTGRAQLDVTHEIQALHLVIFPCGIADTLVTSPKGVSASATAAGRPEEQALSVPSSAEKPLVQFGSMSKLDDGSSIYTGVKFGTRSYPVVVTMGAATMQADKVSVAGSKLDLSGNVLISKGDGSPDVEGQHAGVSIVGSHLQVEKTP